MSDTRYLMRQGKPRIAYRKRGGGGPAIVFLPGYRSDMTGAKAEAIDAWAAEQGRACVRFDYAGCGESGGAFEEATLAGWRDDALAVLDTLVEGPVVLVGSSMGGWLMLLLAKERPERIAGLLGIAAAPDFTDWGFSQDEKMTILSSGRLERANPYGPEPALTTRGFWQSGEANRVLQARLATTAPARFVHGMADDEVPWRYAAHAATLLGSDDVQVTLIKDGEHRLSREVDIAVILRALGEIVEPR